MRLYLQGLSENNIGYTADWLAFYYTKGNEDFRVTIDLQGKISYNTNTLNLRYKGDIIPWEIVNLTTSDVLNLAYLEPEKVKEIMPLEKLKEIIAKSEKIFIGLYPTVDSDEWDKAIHDKLTNCQGRIEIGDFVREFTEFDWEIPL